MRLIGGSERQCVRKLTLPLLVRHLLGRTLLRKAPAGREGLYFAGDAPLGGDSQPRIALKLQCEDAPSGTGYRSTDR